MGKNDCSTEHKKKGFVASFLPKDTDLLYRVGDFSSKELKSIHCNHNHYWHAITKETYDAYYRNIKAFDLGGLILGFIAHIIITANFLFNPYLSVIGRDVTTIQSFSLGAVAFLISHFIVFLGSVFHSYLWSFKFKVKPKEIDLNLCGVVFDLNPRELELEILKKG